MNGLIALAALHALAGTPSLSWNDCPLLRIAEQDASHSARLERASAQLFEHPNTPPSQWPDEQLRLSTMLVTGNAPLAAPILEAAVARWPNQPVVLERVLLHCQGKDDRWSPLCGQTWADQLIAIDSDNGWAHLHAAHQAWLAETTSLAFDHLAAAVVADHMSPYPIAIDDAIDQSVDAAMPGGEDWGRYLLKAGISMAVWMPNLLAMCNDDPGEACLSVAQRLVDETPTTTARFGMAVFERSDQDMNTKRFTALNEQLNDLQQRLFCDNTLPSDFFFKQSTLPPAQLLGILQETAAQSTSP